MSAKKKRNKEIKMDRLQKTIDQEKKLISFYVSNGMTEKQAKEILEEDIKYLMYDGSVLVASRYWAVNDIYERTDFGDFLIENERQTFNDFMYNPQLENFFPAGGNSIVVRKPDGEVLIINRNNISSYDVEKFIDQYSNSYVTNWTNTEDVYYVELSNVR